MMEQANSANFTIAALLGSARPQQELVREAAVFHESLHGTQRGSLGSMIESDEEDEQESQLPGRLCLEIDVCDLIMMRFFRASNLNFTFLTLLIPWKL